MPFLNRTLSTGFRALVAVTALYVLGVCAYHIHKTKPHLSHTLWATSFISGLGSLWAVLTAALICCIHSPFLLLPVALIDLVFCGGFIAVSVLQRRMGRRNCHRQGTLCRVDKTSFALAVASA